MSSLSKSLQLFFIAVLYLAITIFLKWRIDVSWIVLLYVGGFAVGLNLIAFIEYILKTSRDVVKSFFAQLIIHVLTIFVLTSSTSLFGKGVMLGLHLEQLLILQSLLSQKGAFIGWFEPNAPTPQMSTRMLQWLWGVFIIYTLLFLLI